MLVVEAIDKDKDNWWFVIGYLLVGIGFGYCFITGSYPLLMGIVFWSIVLSVALYSIVKLSGIILTRNSNFSIFDSAVSLLIIFFSAGAFFLMMMPYKEYESCIYDENKNLIGIEFRNYATYKGGMSYSIFEFKGVPNGTGEIIYPDGQSREVVYDLGKTDKKSIYLYDENGDLRSFTLENSEIKYNFGIYRGAVVTIGNDRIRSGQGQLAFTADMTFESRVLNFFKGNSGNIYKNGDFYNGQWVDDKMSGKGVYIWANGDRYEGDFVDDAITGMGVLTMANGEKYEGEFVDGKPVLEENIPEIKDAQSNENSSGNIKDKSTAEPVKTDNSVVNHK